MIFKRGRKRGSESAVDESSEDVGVDELDESAEADQESVADDVADEDFAALDELDWRSSGPYDISEVESIESTEESPKIDLGSLILTAVPNAELRLQVAEETGEVMSAMLVLETPVYEGFDKLSPVEPPASANQKPQTYSSALELGAYAAPHRPSALAASTCFCPCGVMRPALVNRAMFTRLIWLQMLFALRGE